MSWTGIDLDGTLAMYHEWGKGEIGDPVPKMLERVKNMLDAGKEVRIYTARVSIEEGPELDRQRRLIEAWCLEHIGQILPITCKKDFGMVECFDDRAIQVIPNTGVRVDGKI